MNKKTKLILGGLTLLGLIFAYKKGVFGGSKSDAPADEDIVDNRKKYEAPDKPTQASVPPADKPVNTPSGGGSPVASPPPSPVNVNIDTMAKPMNWASMKPAYF